MITSALSCDELHFGAARRGTAYGNCMDVVAIELDLALQLLILLRYPISIVTEKLLEMIELDLLERSYRASVIL